MTGLRCSAALLGLALAAPSLPAQGVFIAYPAPPYGYPVGGFVSFGHGHSHGHLSGSIGGPYGYGYAPYGYVSNRVTVIVTPPPLVVDPFDRLSTDEETLERLRAALQDDVVHPIPPAGNRPKPPEALNAPAPAPAQPPVQPPAPPPVQPPMPPAPRVPLPENLPDLPMPPAPLNNPDAEYARLMDLGRDAFANAEYGRAADRFRQASAVAPNRATPFFLLGQTLFARGKYHDAVDAIHAGMVLQPDWPDSPFRPVELYGPHPADYADQLRALEDALDRRPGDPDLLFLDAYVLWFDGRKDDARPLFQMALPGAVDPGMVLRFLRAAAGPASL